MKQLHVSEDIVPLGEFKTHASKALRHVRESGRPIVITQNGKPAGVLLSPKEFDRLTERERFVSAVRDGLKDADNGSVVADHDLEAALPPDLRSDNPG